MPYADAPAHTGPKHSDTFITILNKVMNKLTLFTIRIGLHPGPRARTVNYHFPVNNKKVYPLGDLTGSGRDLAWLSGVQVPVSLFWLQVRGKEPIIVISTINILPVYCKSKIYT